MTAQLPNPRSVFGRAVELESLAERKAYLSEACAGAPEVRERVEALLRAHEAAGGFLQLATPAPGDTATYTPSLEAPAAIGPYKLLEKIGEGGMGEVWVADQQEPIRRRVALKLIKPGMDSRGVLARFEAERQALAVMDHPNIAKVLDADTTPDGRPYFVMDLVKGTPITEFCDLRKLTPKERLELFVPVCQAIQHAHQKGIIHRDIKPTNVLVELYDDRAVPKVIDFGVAKAVGHRLTERTIYTGFGALVGTPTYMAPEQATFNALDVDTRADVYALGVLLYELLAGSPPVEPERLKAAALDEVLRIVRDEEPVRPSQRLSTSQARASIAATRQSDPGSLSQMMKGELDWIVMKALEKDRTRRYDTATALARDLQRYLAGDAVEACPPTLGYRLRKVYRRNKTAALTGSAFALLLTVGVAVSSVLAVQATAAQHVAQQGQKAADNERDHANQALERLKRVTAERRADQYAMTMMTLPVAWEAGNTTEAQRLLDSLRPGPDEDDLRHFEWRFWDRQRHAELSATQLSVPPLSEDRGHNYSRRWIMSADGSRVSVLRHTRSESDRSRKVMLVQVWDIATRKRLLSHEVPDDTDNPRDDLFADYFLSFSRDGKRLGISADAFVARPSRVRYRRQAVDVDTGKVLLDRMNDGQTNSTLARIEVSPDGRFCITRTLEKVRGGSATVWDLNAGGKEVATLAGLQGAKFIADGAQILGWEPGSAPKVWNAATGEEVRALDARSGASGWSPSPDGTRLYGISGGFRQEEVSLKVFDLTTGKELPKIPLIDSRLGISRNLSSNLPLISRDGSRLAVRRFNTVNWDHVEWLVIDTKDGRTLFAVDDSQSAQEMDHRSVGACFSPDGKLFVLHCYTDNSVVIHDATTGARLRTIRGLTGPLAAFAVTPDGQRLHTVERDGTLKEWRLTPDDPVRIEAGGRIETMAMRGLERSADGKWLVAQLVNRAPGGNEVVRAWDTSGKESKEFKARPRAAVEGYRFLTGFPVISRDGGRVALVRNVINTSKLDAGQKADPQQPMKQVPPGDLTVWDVASGKELLHVEGDFHRFPTAIAPDGSSVAVVRQGEKDAAQVVVFDVGSGRERRSIPLPQGVSLGDDLKYRPDGKRFAGFLFGPRNNQAEPGYEDTPVVWDIADGKRLEDFKFEPFPHRLDEFLEWSPDGKRLIVATTATADRTLTVHDAETGRVVATLDTASRGGGIPGGARPAFSPDGRRIACPVLTTRGRFVKVWDAASGRELLALPWNEGSDRGLRRLQPELVAFSTDGNRLLDFALKQPALAGPRGFGGAGLPGHVIDVTTWDATPRSEPKESGTDD